MIWTVPCTAASFWKIRIFSPRPDNESRVIGNAITAIRIERTMQALRCWSTSNHWPRDLVGIGARAWWFRASASDERSKKGLTKIRMRRRQDSYQGTASAGPKSGEREITSSRRRLARSEAERTHQQSKGRIIAPGSCFLTYHLERRKAS